MKLGTKTLLFGVHQLLIHPILVTISWVKLYNSFPSWRELICIVVHDWGYWGKPSLKCADGDKHPELGGKIAWWLFGVKYRDFVLGHSSFYVKRNGISKSKLFYPDKYWHCMIPLWFYKILAVPTGEFDHYRGLKHARKVSELNATDQEWWNNLQQVCLDKINHIYEIDENTLD